MKHALAFKTLSLTILGGLGLSFGAAAQHDGGPNAKKDVVEVTEEPDLTKVGDADASPPAKPFQPKLEFDASAVSPPKLGAPIEVEPAMKVPNKPSIDANTATPDLKDSEGEKK